MARGLTKGQNDNLLTVVVFIIYMIIAGYCGYLVGVKKMQREALDLGHATVLQLDGKPTFHWYEETSSPDK